MIYFNISDNASLTGEKYVTIALAQLSGSVLSYRLCMVQISSVASVNTISQLSISVNSNPAQIITRKSKYFYPLLIHKTTSKLLTRNLGQSVVGGGIYLN